MKCRVSKCKILDRFNCDVYALSFIRRFYFMFARKFYACTHVKITRQWTSTLMKLQIQLKKNNIL